MADENWADLKKAATALRTGKGGKALPGQPLALRVFAACVETSSGCWEFQGRRNQGNYGLISIGRDKLAAHRIAYGHVFGPFQDDLLVCHSCDNPPCCNPAHLFIGTYTDNNQDCSRKGRQWQLKKTHCPQGHEYTADNLVVYREGSRPQRKCLICNRAATNRSRARASSAR